MTEQKFKEIEEIATLISNHERNFKIIDSLIRGNGLVLKITGNSYGRTSMLAEYFSHNQEEIIEILVFRKDKILNELMELKKIFSEM